MGAWADARLIFGGANFRKRVIPPLAAAEDGFRSVPAASFEMIQAASFGFA